MIANIWIFYVSMFGSIAISCALFCSESLAKTVPTNYILMFAFTAFEAITVSFLCAIIN